MSPSSLARPYDEELTAMVKAKCSMQTMSEELNLTPPTIYKRMKELGLRPTRNEDIDADKLGDLLDKYQDPKVQVTEILEEFNLDYSGLYRILISTGTPTRTVAKRAANESSITELRLKKALEMYEEGCELTEIRDETGVYSVQLYAYMRVHGIPTRLEAKRNAYKAKYQSG